VKFGFGWPINQARANRGFFEHGRPIVVLMAVEEYERPKVFEMSHVRQPHNHDREYRIMDQAIHDGIAFFMRGIKANLGSRSDFTLGSRTHSADLKMSEFSRWR
jgi:hypothetical protein